MIWQCFCNIILHIENGPNNISLHSECFSYVSASISLANLEMLTSLIIWIDPNLYHNIEFEIQLKNCYE